MSPHVGNFVQDLVEMAKATETLPQVQVELEQTKHKLDDALQAVQDREEAIQRYKHDIEELQSKIRATEAERDDAELRFLELDEKAHKVLAHVAAIQAGADAVKDFLEPPKPEPVKEPEPVHPPQTDDPNLPQGQGEAHPSTQHSQTSGENAGEGSPTSQGQSKSHPIPASTHQENSTGSVESTATQLDAALSPNHGPYSGKLYHDMPNYIPRSEWLAGGGTDHDYDWYPSRDQH